MSVSEKLTRLMNDEGGWIIVGALDETPLHVVGGPVPASVTARNILPQIVAVVEMTERLIFDNGTRSRQQMWRDAEAALISLEESLP